MNTNLHWRRRAAGFPWSILILLFYVFASFLFAQSPTDPLVINAPNGARIVVFTNPPPPTPLSVQMRVAAQAASHQAAPFTTRFSVVKVDERQVVEPGRDETGLPTPTNTFTTNYIVTLQPIPLSETQPPLAFGAVKNGQLRLRLEYPVKIGDKLDLSPVPVQ